MAKAKTNSKAKTVKHSDDSLQNILELINFMLTRLAALTPPARRRVLRVVNTYFDYDDNDDDYC